MIMNIFYKIWVDCLVRMKSQEKNKDDWKMWSMIAMTSAMTCNFLFLMAILQWNVLGFTFYYIKTTFLPERENNVFSILILYVLPIIIINYSLIFRKNRFDKLIKKYPYYNGKLFVVYFSISLFFPLILLFAGIIIYQDVTIGSFFGM